MSRTSLTKYAPMMRDDRAATSPDQMQAMQSGAWQRRWLCVSLDDPRLDDWEQAKLNAVGVKLFGQRRT